MDGWSLLQAALATQECCSLPSALGQELVLGHCQELFAVSCFEAIASFHVGPAAVSRAAQENTLQGCMQGQTVQRSAVNLTNLQQLRAWSIQVCSPGACCRSLWSWKETSCGSPGHWLEHWDTTDRTMSCVWINLLCIPTIFYLKLLKDSCRRSFIFFTMLFFLWGRGRGFSSFSWDFSNSRGENIGRWRFSCLLQEFSPVSPLDHLLPDLGYANKTVWMYFMWFDVRRWSTLNNHSNLASVIFFFLFLFFNSFHFLRLAER